MDVTVSRRVMQSVSILGIIGCIVFALYLYQIGALKDIETMRQFVGRSVILGPIVFILIQIVQVVIPIIPGGISLAAGVLIFGPWYGFLYNYIGIVLGSIIIFLLGRYYGKPLAIHLINEKTYSRYSHWLSNQGRFDRWFALAIFLPVAPDDALCLMAGLTEISVKKFTWIILLGKPLSIYMYSFALTYGFDYLLNILS